MREFMTDEEAGYWSKRLEENGYWSGDTVEIKKAVEDLVQAYCTPGKEETFAQMLEYLAEQFDVEIPGEKL